MKIRVANKYSSFQKSSKEYKNESRRAKNEYFNSLSNVWKNPILFLFTIKVRVTSH